MTVENSQLGGRSIFSVARGFWSSNGTRRPGSSSISRLTTNKSAWRSSSNHRKFFLAIAGMTYLMFVGFLRRMMSTLQR